jgi:hypothetical protein
VEYLYGKEQFGPWIWWEDNIKMVLKEMKLDAGFFWLMLRTSGGLQ